MGTQTNTIKISELPAGTTLVGLFTIGVDANNRSVKVSLEFIKTAADNANSAAGEARTAAAIALNLPKIQDGTWWTYDTQAGNYTNTGIPATGPQGPAGHDGQDGAPGAAGRDGQDGAPGAAGRDGQDGAPGADGTDGKDGKDARSPKIQNGTWWVFNDATQQYEDTGQSVSAEYVLTKEKIEGVFTGEISTHTHDEQYVKIETGKGLSSNDYTNSDKTLVGTIEEKLGAQEAQDIYQPKGEYALKTEIPDISGLATSAQLSKKADKIPLEDHGTSDTTFELTPNIQHIWGEVAALNLTIADGEAGIANEYMFQFQSGTSATTLNLPDTIKWIGGKAPTIAPGKTYQGSIVNNIAVIGEA